MARNIPRIAGSIVLIALLAAGLRQILAPKETPAPQLLLDPDATARLRGLVAASRVDRDSLIRDVRKADILLVGEVHFYQNTVAYLAGLLDDMPERTIALQLELPGRAQPLIDRYLETGDPALLAKLGTMHGALPLQTLLVWARQNRARVLRVVAMDEDWPRIARHRIFLMDDTRNGRMAASVLEARRVLPGTLVVAYGGQMHMLLAGRYRYDREDRVPMGSRLLRAGVERSHVRSLILSGQGMDPICGLADPGTILTGTGPIGSEPSPVFFEYPLFGVKEGRELFDYFVNLGELKRVPI